MIKANVILDYPDWKKKIKNPSNYIIKKLKTLSKIPSFRNKKQEFTLLLTNNRKMKSLNNKFRKKNKATDVLSFPFYSITELKKGKRKKKYLGDVAISYEFVINRSKLTNFELEFDKLWLHGYLHLLGYNHQNDSDYYKMRKIENKILKFIHKRN